MKYVVFTKYPHNVTPISEWVEDVVQDTIIVTKKSFIDQYSDKFYTIGLEDYDSEKEKLETIRDICSDNAISHIGVLSESDIISVAKCREIGEVPGQSLFSACSFRNKFLMKKLASSAEVSVPKHKLVQDIMEIREFVSRVGFPIVLKPVDGAGSVSTKVLRCEDDLNEINKNSFSERFLVEQFISDEMVHADGFVDRGQITLLSISKYFNNCLSYQNGKPLGSMQLEESSQLWKNTKEYLQQLLSALPCSKVMAFHCEFFVIPNDKLVFCEIASRVGGGRIVEVISKSHGVNLFKIWLRAQLGLSYSVIGSRDTAKLFSFVIIPPNEGTIISIPEEPEWSWISDIQINCKIGSKIESAKSSIDSIVSFIITAENSLMLQQRINQAIDYYGERILYQ